MDLNRVGRQIVDWIEFITEFGLLRTWHCNFGFDILDFRRSVGSAFVLLGCYVAYRNFGRIYWYNKDCLPFESGTNALSEKLITYAA